MPTLHVSAVDVWILVVYVIGTRILFSWYFARKTQTGSEQYFLAGRKLRWPVIGLSFYVANMSGASFVGLAGSGYHSGIAVYNYEWLPAVILVCFVVFLLPLYLKQRVFTAPQYLEHRYGRSCRLAFSGFLLLANIFIDAAVGLYGGALVVQAVYPNLSLFLIIAVISLITGLYIFFGGLGAVIINDALQAALILIGGAVVTFLAWRKIPSWEAVRQASPPEAFHLIQPANDPLMPWPGLVTGVLVIGIYFWCMNQTIIQRALGARSLDHARWGSLFAAALKIPNLFLFVLPGLMAAALYPSLEKPDLAFPVLAFDLLPVGLRGVLLAAVAAAIFSSLEAILNSASTLFTMDFVHTLRPHASDRTLMNTGRAATIAFMIIAAAWAPQIARFPTLWQYAQSLLAYVTPPVVVIFMFGLFWRRANCPAAVITLTACVPVGAAWWIINDLLAWTSVQFLYGCGVTFLFSAAVFVLTAYLTEPPPQSVLQHMWHPSIWREESRDLHGTPRHRNYRWLAAILLLVTAGVVVWWA
ncbi:MAG: sodium/solute symporter [Phycisphaerae bacterium]|nr:sodium/solute symporter [Phycisphaerae bacterium]